MMQALTAFIPAASSPVQTLNAIAPLLEAIGPVLSNRIVSPTRPPWMDDQTETYLKSVSDDELAKLERQPHFPVFPGRPPTFLTHLQQVARPLLSAFPYATSPNGGDVGDLQAPFGRSKRKSKARPQARKRVQIRAVSDALSDALLHTRRSVRRVVDIGAGVGHLSNHLAGLLDEPVDIVALERDVALCRSAGIVQHRARGQGAGPKRHVIIQADALARTTHLSSGDVLIGLHACGELADSILSQGVEFDASAVVLVSCCLQKIGRGQLAKRPLSNTVRDSRILCKCLTVSRDILGATNSARGFVTDRDLVGRVTRIAIRRLLHDSGVLGLEFGEEVHGISRHALRAGLRNVMPRLYELYDVLPLSEAEIDRRMDLAHREFRVMRALAVPRAFAGAMLEMAVVLDRAAFLEENGFCVSTFRIWPDEISARNLCCVAWR